MAKQKTGCRPGDWIENLWVVWFTSALMIVFCRGNILRAADVVPSSSTISNTTTVLLEYQETDHAIIDWGVSIALQSAPFNKEPAAASGKIVRGILNFGGGSSNAIPFLWQRGAGKLFLDLNRNRDLTDDPAGVFSESLGPTRSAYYQTFTNVHLIFNTLSGKCPVLADIRFWDYGSQPGGNIDIALRSFWQGKVTLQGRDWQVGIVQNVLNESGWFENGRLLLRPWEERNQPFNAYDGSLATVPFSRKLFVDGHACQLDLVAGPQGGEAKPALQFTEQSAALGELKITGKYIQRLVLTGGPYLVILDQPMDTVKVPTGSYNQPEVRIEQNAAEAYRDSNQPQLGARIKVEDKTPVVLNAGGPLTNSVIASRHGQDLRLDYRLIGAGGATYQLVKQDRSRPPEFAVYKSDRKIESGKFEFG